MGGGEGAYSVCRTAARDNAFSIQESGSMLPQEIHPSKMILVQARDAPATILSSCKMVTLASLA